jgi:hypothetical protein
MRALCLVALLVAPLPVAAQSIPPAAPRTTAVKSLAIGPGPIVVITGSGPLPQPTVGVLHSPERIYLDFAGVSARASSAAGQTEIVSSVRVAQHSLEPLVARVVVDLKQPSRYAIDTSQRATGHLQITLTPVGSAAGGRVQPAVPPEVARPSTARPKRSDSAARRYVTRVEAALDDAVSLRQVLQDLDRKTAISSELLVPAQHQLDAIRNVVDTLRPPPALAEAHDLLRSAVGFAATALGLASGSMAEVPGNASSAAAGALMMLERAQAELRPSDKAATDQVAGRLRGW